MLGKRGSDNNQYRVDKRNNKWKRWNFKLGWPNEERGKQQEKQPLHVIHTIHGRTTSGGETMASKKRHIE